MLGGGFHCHTRHMRYLPLLLLLAGISVLAETIHQGKVVKIADGDTLTLLVDSEQLKIRHSQKVGNEVSCKIQPRPGFPCWAVN